MIDQNQQAQRAIQAASEHQTTMETWDEATISAAVLLNSAQMVLL